MNIFILDYDQRKNAEYHCDKHVVKMCLEYAQLLCGVHYYHGLMGAPYKLTHKNHPCAVWARTSFANYEYLKNLAIALGEEYTYRYDKTHKSIQIVLNLSPINFTNIGLTPFVKAISNLKIRNITDPVEAYREYYKQEKAHFTTWKKRQIPEWFNHK